MAYSPEEGLSGGERPTAAQPHVPAVTSAPARRLEIANEFAAVRVEVDETANGPRLRITDLERGTYIELDPFEASTLVNVSEDDLDELARPP